MQEVQKVNRESLKAALHRLCPDYDPNESWAQKQERARKEHIAQAEQLAKERHHRYMLLEENISLFFQTEGLYVKDPEGKITSAELYNVYKRWCLSQNIPLHPSREFWLHAKNHAAQYRLVYSTYIPDQNGKRCRGFYGIRPLKEEENRTTLK